MRHPLSLLLALGLWLAAASAYAANASVTVGPGGSLTFSPANVTVNAGETVTFTYAGGSMPHNVVSDGVFRCAKGCDGDGAGGNGNSTTGAFTDVVTMNNAGTFNYYCEVHGTPTAGMHGTITVNGAAPPPAPDFGITADAATVNLAQGASATVGITLTPQNGFNGSVTYAASGLPTGVTASFANDSATHATLTLTAAAGASTGAGNVNVTASSGSLAHSAVFALSVTATTPAFSITHGITGSWYNPAQSGQGFNIEVLSNNTFVAIWYTFDNVGNNLWLSGVGNYDGDTATIPLSETTGGLFPPNFDPTKIARSNFGTLTIQFTGCNAGTASWTTVDTAHFAAGSMPVQRLTSIDTLACP